MKRASISGDLALAPKKPQAGITGFWGGFGEEGLLSEGLEVSHWLWVV